MSLELKELKYTLAIDLGATNLRAGIISLNEETNEAKIVNQYVEGTISDDKEKLYNQIVSLSNKAISEYPNIQIKTIGVSACGIIEKDRYASSLPNLHVKNVMLADILEKAFPGTKCFVANDANCAAFSESRLGAGKDYNDVIFVTISSGIGTGFVYNKQLVNIPFEGGKIIQTVKGKYVESEYYCSGNGLKNLCKDRGLGELSGKEFFELVAKKDPNALSVYSEWLEYLGLFFGNLQRIFNVDCYVLSGGVMKSSSIFLTDLEKVSNGFVHPYPLKKIKFVQAEYGQDAGIFGAACLGFFFTK